MRPGDGPAAAATGLTPYRRRGPRPICLVQDLQKDAIAPLTRHDATHDEPTSEE